MKKLLAVLLAVCLFVPGVAFSGESIRILSVEFPASAAARAFLNRVIADFNKEYPDVEVVFDYLDPPSLKTKLTTMLQSPERPDAFFTWTGGVFHDQADAGVLKDITDELSDDFKARCASIGLANVTYNGRIYGVPMYAESVVLWYNRAILKQSGVDPDAVKTWDEFLAACEKIKAAGFAPIVVGGKDKWPLHFYYAFLALRIMGMDGIASAAWGEDGGFNRADFINVGKEYLRLVGIEPFQPGFMDTQNPKALGLFGDAKGAFALMFSFLLPAQEKSSTSGKGIGDDLGFIPFPAVAGGKGEPGDTLGGINGWLVTKDSHPDTVKFLEFLVSKQYQTESAKQGFWLPIVKGSEAEIVDPRMKGIAALLGSSPNHQLYLDQALGAVVGAAINDAAAEMAVGDITAEEAAARVEEAREMR